MTVLRPNLGHRPFEELDDAGKLTQGVQLLGHKRRIDLADALTPRFPVGRGYVPHVPHPPQQAFLVLSWVAEVFYGGAAGGGKSDAGLMASLQYADVPGYSALIIRRTYEDLFLPGAIAQRAEEWLSGTGAKRRDKGRLWEFPTSDPARPGDVAVRVRRDPPGREAVSGCGVPVDLRRRAHSLRGAHLPLPVLPPAWAGVAVRVVRAHDVAAGGSAARARRGARRHGVSVCSAVGGPGGHGPVGQAGAGRGGGRYDVGGRAVADAVRVQPGWHRPRVGAGPVREPGDEGSAGGVRAGEVGRQPVARPEGVPGGPGPHVEGGAGPVGGRRLGRG